MQTEGKGDQREKTLRSESFFLIHKSVGREGKGSESGVIIIEIKERDVDGRGS